MSRVEVDLKGSLEDFLLVMMRNLMGPNPPEAYQFAIYDEKGNTVTLRVQVVEVTNPMLVKENAHPGRDSGPVQGP